MHALVVQELTRNQQIKSFNKLHHLRMIHNRDVKQAIIRHGIRCLPVPLGIAYTYGHNLSLHCFAIYFQMHLIFKPLEDHQRHGEHERQCTRPQKSTRLVPKIHYGRKKSYVYTIQEIAMTLLPIFVGISHTSQINLPDSSFLQPFHGLLHITIPEAPIMREIIHNTIWYYPERNRRPRLLTSTHQTIHGIIKSRITTDNNYRLVAIVYRHIHQPDHAAAFLTLHEVIDNIICLQAFLNFFPSA